MRSVIAILSLLLILLVPFQLQGQTKSDTLFYELKAEMIDQIKVENHPVGDVDQYYLLIKLKEQYHAEFGQLTSNNIGNHLALTRQGEIIHPAFPTILTKIASGYISMAEFKTEQEAKEIMKQIRGETY